MTKRILSLLLALIMCLSLLPTAAFAAPGRTITMDDIPDPFFQRDLSTLPGGEDGEFTPEEIAKIKKIKVTWPQTEDVTGIEYFTELEELDIQSTNVRFLDLRRNPKIQRVNVSNCQLLCADLPANAGNIQWEDARSQRTAMVSELEHIHDLPDTFDYRRASNVVGGSFTGGKLERRGALIAYDYKVTDKITLHSSVEVESGPCTSAIVKFQLDHYGSWADGSRYPIYVEVPWNQGGKAATLPQSKIPTGIKADPGFENKGWSPAVNTRPNGITEKITKYTYQFKYLPRVNVTGNVFPDPYLLEIIKSLPGAEDGMLVPDEIAKIKTLDCSNRPIQVLEGIQHLTALESVNIQNTDVFFLNLENHPKIRSLAVGGSPLYSIKLHPDAHVTHWDVTETEPYRMGNHVPVDRLFAFQLDCVGRTWGGNFNNAVITFTGPILRYEYTVDGQTFLFSLKCGDQLDPTTATQTFTLSPGGVWADGTTGPIYVDVRLRNGKGTLSQSQIPQVKDSKTSVAVGWEQEPDTTPGAIRGDEAYTYRFQAKQSRATVTFRVVNGTWSDGTTADKTVPMNLTEGRGTLRASQIPQGMRPAAGYELGDWNIQPDTSQGAVIHDVTYTYAFAKEQIPTITVGSVVLDDLTQDYDNGFWRWDASENRLYFEKGYVFGPIQAVKVKNLNLCRYAGLPEEECWNESSFGWGSTKGVIDRYVHVAAGLDNCHFEDRGTGIMRIDSQNRGTYRLELQPEDGLNIATAWINSSGNEEPLELISGPVGRVEMTVRVADPLETVKFRLHGHHTAEHTMDNAYPLTYLHSYSEVTFDTSHLISLPGAGDDLNSLALGMSLCFPNMAKNQAVQLTHSTDNDKVELILFRKENGRYVELQTMTDIKEEVYIFPEAGDYYLLWYYRDSYPKLLQSQVSARLDYWEKDNTPPVDLSKNPTPAADDRWDWDKTTHTLTLHRNYVAYQEIQPAFIHEGDLRVEVEGYNAFKGGGRSGIVVKNGDLTVHLQPAANMTMNGLTQVGLRADGDVIIDGTGALRFNGRGTAISAGGAIRFVRSPMLDLKVTPDSPNAVFENMYGDMSIPGLFQLLDEDQQTIYTGTWSEGVEQGRIVMKNIHSNTGLPPACQLFVEDRGAMIPVKGIHRPEQEDLYHDYQITFRPGEAQGQPPAPLVATSTEESCQFTLPGPGSLKETNSEFVGWKEAKTGKIYREGQRITLTADNPVITMDAQWFRLPQISLSVPEAKSGTVPADFLATRDAQGRLVIDIPAKPIPQRDGCDFVSYLLEANNIFTVRCQPGDRLLVDEVGESHYYILRASWKTHQEPTIPAPGSFQVVVRSDGKPYLTWDAVEGADRYEVQRAIDDGAFQDFYQPKSTSTALRNGSAVPGNVYRYRIRAVVGGEAGPWATANGVMACCAQPKVEVSHNSDGKPVLTWDKVEYAQKYDVLRSVDGGPFTHLTYASGTRLTNSSAKPGVTYRYQVVAVSGVSDADSIPAQTPAVQCSMAAPALKLTTRASDGKPCLTWEKVDGADHYKVYRKVGKSGTYSLLKGDVQGTSLRNSSTKPGTTYYYYVVAVAADGTESERSSIKYITCDCARPNVTARLKNGKPYLTWGKITGAIKYEVYRSVNGGSYDLLTTVKGTSLTNGSAKKGQTCKYRVKAICSNKYGNSALSYIDTVKVQ